MPTATYDDKDIPLLPGLQPRSFVKIAKGETWRFIHGWCMVFDACAVTVWAAAELIAHLLVPSASTGAAYR